MNISRYYICDSCDYRFVISQDRDEALKKKCPECGKHSLYQDLAGQHSFVYQECKTVGHQAERNTERMGKYELETKRSSQNKKTKKPTAWYNKEGKNLKKELSVLDTPEKKQDYILKGKI